MPACYSWIYVVGTRLDELDRGAKSPAVFLIEGTSDIEPNALNKRVMEPNDRMPAMHSPRSRYTLGRVPVYCSLAPAILHIRDSPLPLPIARRSPRDPSIRAFEFLEISAKIKNFDFFFTLLHSMPMQRTAGSLVASVGPRGGSRICSEKMERRTVFDRRRS